MAQLTWEKPADKLKVEEKLKRSGKNDRLKFLLGGILIFGAVIYLALSGTLAGARYFISVDDVVTNADYAGQTVRITGAVLGDSIQYDANTGELAFTIAHIPDQYPDFATALNEAVNDPTRTQLKIYMEKQVMPDLLQHEAQAILTGKMGADGVFYGSELNLKCPSRFEEDGAAQIQNAE